LAAGNNSQQYGKNPHSWVDPLGLTAGKAVMRHYQTTPPTKTGRYTIEVTETVTASKIHTHLVHSPDKTSTKALNERREQMMSEDEVLHTHEIPLKDATAAQLPPT
jgi:hypothetical protein